MNQNGMVITAMISVVQKAMEITREMMDRTSPVVDLESKLPASLLAIMARIMPAIPTKPKQKNAIIPQISEAVALPSPGRAIRDGGPV